MSVLPHPSMLDPRFLPATNGQSEYPPGTVFMPCPGNGTPWGAFHLRPTFLAMKPCKPSKKVGAYKVYVYCAACGFRGFFAGEFWHRGGVSRQTIVRQFGPGIAADDNNGLL